jgi:hypothetical protein
MHKQKLPNYGVYYTTKSYPFRGIERTLAVPKIEKQKT